MPTLISTQVILQKVTTNAGPRIGKVEVYEFEGVRTTVNYWYDANGRLVRVS